MPRRTDPLLERALLDTNLQLGPQENALRQLLSSLASDHSRRRSVNAGNARGIKQATVEAQPGVARAFDTALGSVAAQRAALGQGGPADPQAAAYERRVGEQRATALADLIQQGVRADTGRVYANEQARSEYEGGKAKVLGDLQELSGRAGAQTASTYGKLQDDRAQRGLTRRGQDVTARGQSLSSADRAATLAETQRHNRAQESNATAKAQGAKGPKPASQEQHARARDGINEAIALIEQQRRRGVTSRAEIIQQLTTGRPASEREVDGEKVKLPAIPKLPADFVRAASNLVFDGTLSRGDVARLHNLRLRIRSLGYPTRKGGGQGPRSQAGGVAGSVAGNIPGG